MPKGPQAQRIPTGGEARLRPSDPRHVVFVYSICSLSVYVSEQVYKYFNSLEIMWPRSSIDPVCFAEEGEEASLYTSSSSVPSALPVALQ